MLNLNVTFVFQLVMFLLFLWVLSKFLFKPIIQTFDERIEKTEGLTKKVVEIEKEIKSKTSEYEEKRNKARAEAIGIKDNLKNEGLEEEKQLLKAVSQEAKREVEEKKGGIYRDIEQLKMELSKHVDKISSNIVEKVLGRRVK